MARRSHNRPSNDRDVSMECPQPIVAEFLAKHPLAESMFDLFDSSTDIYFAVKDRASRFVRANQNMLNLYDLNNPSDLIGRTNKDFHHLALADAYIAEDRRVMESGAAVANQLWLVPHVSGMPRWFVSSKVPLKDHRGEIVGVAGAMFRVGTPADKSHYFESIQPAIKFMEEHVEAHISMQELAELCGLSSTSFNRHFRTLLRTTPGEFLLALRVETARQLLITSDMSLAAVATDCGFVDQSHFTKRFQRVTGTTPHQYRERFRN